MEAEYRLAVQHGQRGYYAVVRLEVKLVSFFRGARVTFVDAGSPWKAAVDFGVAYAYARTIGGGPTASGAEVSVREILSQPVDTTEILIAFATVHAFCKAIGKEPPQGLRLDPVTNEVVFPR